MGKMRKGISVWAQEWVECGGQRRRAPARRKEAGQVAFRVIPWHPSVFTGADSRYAFG